MLKTYNELKQLKSPSEEEFMLLDRLQKIESVINQYGEDKFAISFSGGKDSTVLSALVDLALGPQNLIPRVYVNTGIELHMVRDFVFDMAKHDKRVEIIKPQVPIKPMLEKEGYPFKSKAHAHYVDRYNRLGMCDSIKSYLGEGKWGPKYCCPKSLKYQFTPEFKDRLKLSDACCLNMKEKPLIKWGIEHNRPISMVGVMRDEGGRRERATCLAFEGGKLKRFQPLSVITKEWEEWFIKEYKIEICPIYLPPYNRTRTGCVGCPFSLDLENAEGTGELQMLEKFFPAERKQAEIIWGKVYDEYRRLGYRLKDEQKTNVWIRFDDIAAYNSFKKIFEQITSMIPQGESNCYIYLEKEHVYKPINIDPYYIASLADKLAGTFGSENIALSSKS